MRKRNEDGQLESRGIEKKTILFTILFIVSVIVIAFSVGLFGAYFYNFIKGVMS